MIACQVNSKILFCPGNKSWVDLIKLFEGGSLPLTLAGRGGLVPPPQTVFPELPEYGGAQRRRFRAMLPYIQGGPDDVLKIFRSGQVTDL